MESFWKRIVMAGGVLLAVPGLVLGINLFCLVPIMLFDQGSEAVPYGIASLTLAVLTLGAGWALFRQADRSLKGKPSKVLRLPPLYLGVGIFVLLLTAGLFFSDERHFLAGLLLPPILLVLAALPPLWAVSWFTPRPPDARPQSKPETTSPGAEIDPAAVLRAKTISLEKTAQLESPPESGLTWRRGLVAFCGGATVSVLLAIILEILLPVAILALVFNAFSVVRGSLETLFNNLTSNTNLGQALTSPAFVYIFIQVAVIAPLVEELVKPLVTLPLLRHLNRREAFWVGALAGAGFAALENVIYAGSGLGIWAGILAVRALGGALHPLGSGLTALGWRGILRGEPDAPAQWLKYYALAVLAHAAWNGGSLLVITLGGAQFFGSLPAEIGILGLPMAGTTLAFLLILGMAGLWVGRAYGHDRPLTASPAPEADQPHDRDFVSWTVRQDRLSERGVALWGVACLLALVPAGIAGLELWLR